MNAKGLQPKDIGINMCAFLDVIAYSEGTDKYPCNGYQTIVGGAQFEDFSTHPNVRVWFKHYKLFSTAAGRYQLLYRYWVAYSKQLRLYNFSPISQDLIAIKQIREQGAYADIKAGRIIVAIEKCANIWASFPGAGYKQRENKMSDLLEVYKKARQRYETAK